MASRTFSVCVVMPMDLPEPMAALAPPELRPPGLEVHSFRVWKGRAWELGVMLAAAGMLACLAL